MTESNDIESSRDPTSILLASCPTFLRRDLTELVIIWDNWDGDSFGSLVYFFLIGLLLFRRARLELEMSSVFSKSLFSFFSLLYLRFLFLYSLFEKADWSCAIGVMSRDVSILLLLSDYSLALFALLSVKSEFSWVFCCDSPPREFLFFFDWDSGLTGFSGTLKRYESVDSDSIIGLLCLFLELDLLLLLEVSGSSLFDLFAFEIDLSFTFLLLSSYGPSSSSKTFCLLFFFLSCSYYIWTSSMLFSRLARLACQQK